MGAIKKLFDADEKVLWQETFSKSSKKACRYVITNKRIYQKSSECTSLNTGRAPKDFVKLEDAVLVIERLGIKSVKIVDPQSIAKKMNKVAKNIKKAIEQAKSNEKVKKALNSVQQTFSKGFDPQTGPFQTKDSEKKKKKKDSGGNSGIPAQFNSPVDKEQLKKLIEVFKKLKKLKGERKDIEVYLKFSLDDKPSLVVKKQKLENAEKIKRIMDDWSVIPSDYKEKVWKEILPALDKMNSIQPSIESDGNDQKLFVPTIYPELNAACNIESQNVSYASDAIPSASDIASTYELENDHDITAQIIEILDKNTVAGSCCCTCGEDILQFEERIYTCKDCGVLYHENCLKKVINDGICQNCNKILLW